jgi:hypothetical protein
MSINSLMTGEGPRACAPRLLGCRGSGFASGSNGVVDSVDPRPVPVMSAPWLPKNPDLVKALSPQFTMGGLGENGQVGGREPECRRSKDPSSGSVDVRTRRSAAGRSRSRKTAARESVRRADAALVTYASLGTRAKSLLWPGWHEMPRAALQSGDRLAARSGSCPLSSTGRIGRILGPPAAEPVPLLHGRFRRPVRLLSLQVGRAFQPAAWRAALSSGESRATRQKRRPRPVFSRPWPLAIHGFLA